MSDFFKQQIISPIYAKTTEKLIKKRLSDYIDIPLNIGGLAPDKVDELILDLKAESQAETERKKSFDEKARACLFIITLAVTIIILIVNSMISQGNEISSRPIEYLLLALAIIYFAASGLTSIGALNIRKYYGTYLDGLFRKEGESLTPINRSSSEIVSSLYNYTKRNQMVNTIRANFIYATLTGIRNGVILVSVFFIILISKGVLNGMDLSKIIDAMWKQILLINAWLSIILAAQITSYMLIILGSIGLILFATKFSFSTRTADLKYANERLLSLNGYQVWKYSWAIIIAGNIIQLVIVLVK